MVSPHQQYHAIFRALGYASIVVSTYLFIMGYDFADIFTQNFINFMVLLTIGIFCAFMEIRIPQTKTEKEVIDGAGNDTVGETN